MKRKLLKCLTLFLTAVLLYTAFCALSIWRYAEVDERRNADAAIVLGAGTDGYTVSPVFRERLKHGVWLYHNGYVSKLILTGGVTAGNERSDARIAGDLVMSLGVPEEDILFEETSTITQENISGAKAIMDEQGLSTAILVSDPLHMKRAMRMAKDCGMDACSSPTPTSRYISLKTKLPFLARETFFYVGYQIYRLFH